MSEAPLSELLLRSATELAALVRAGELSARELVEASLRRIDELEPTINAFTHVAHESALAAADAIDRRGFAAVRRRSDRDQGQPAGHRDAADDGQ